MPKFIQKSSTRHESIERKVDESTSQESTSKSAEEHLREITEFAGRQIELDESVTLTLENIDHVLDAA